MAKFTHITNSFRSGQLGEALVGRTDIEEYRTGCLELKNMISSKVGGAFRRGGFKALQSVPYTPSFSTGRVGLIPFVLEGESYLVAFKESDGSGGTTDWNPLVVDSEGSPLFGGGVSTDIRFENIDDIRWTQYGRLLFICGARGDIPPLVFSIGDGNLLGPIWNLRPYLKTSDLGVVPYSDEAEILRHPYTPNTELDLKVFYTRDTDEADDTILFRDGSGTTINMRFDDGDLGRAIRFRVGSEEVAGIVTEVVDTSTIKIERGVGARPTNGHETDDWALGSWSKNAGYPRTVTTFQNRIIWGGNQSEPLTLWASAVQRPFALMQDKLFQDDTSDVSGINYFGELDDLQAFDFPISSTASTSITWLGSQRSLHVGTDTVEYALASDAGGFGAISFPSLRAQTFHGGRNVQPGRMGRFSVYVSEDGISIRDFSYSDQNGSHVSRDLSVLSPDLIYSNLKGNPYLGTGFVQLAWQESNRTMWLLSNRGVLFSFAFEENSNLKAWAYHELGGDLTVDSMAVIPYKGVSTLFIVGNREIDGVKAPLIYRLVAPTQDPKYFEGSGETYYLDGGICYDYGEPTSEHDAGWLEGLEVYAIIDGEEKGPFLVEDETFETEPTESICFGLRYEHKLTTMPLEAGTIIGSAQGQLKRVDRVFFDMYRSKGSVLEYPGTFHDIEYPQTPAFESFTGRVISEYESTPDERYLVTIRGDKALPFGLLNLTFRGVTQD